MAKIIKEMTLDVVRENIGGTVTAKQNDIDSRFIKAVISADRHALSVNPEGTVMINGCRPDGEAGGFVGEINPDGSVTVPLTSWMLSLPGTLKCDITVFDGTERLTTMPFFVSVEESLYTGDGIENEENYTVLSALMEEMQEIRHAESLRVSAEDERGFAEGLREIAETLRETSEAARADAEEKRALAEDKRATFIPSVSASGIISWSNDKGLTNPTPVSIKGTDGRTPVRGTDYWTENDKTEIVQAVMLALPSAEEVSF